MTPQEIKSKALEKAQKRFGPDAQLSYNRSIKFGPIGWYVNNLVYLGKDIHVAYDTLYQLEIADQQRDLFEKEEEPEPMVVNIDDDTREISFHTTPSTQPTPCQQAQAKASVISLADYFPKKDVETGVNNPQKGYPINIMEVPYSNIKNLTKELTKEPISQQKICNRDWLTIKQMSELCGISTRYLRKIILKEEWLGCQLTVRKVDGNTGQGGVSYEVYAPSLPHEYMEKWYAQFIETIPTPMAQWPDSPTTLDPHATRRKDMALWRYNLIKEIVAYPRFHSMRAQGVVEVCSKEHLDLDGNPQKLHPATIYRWVDAYQKGGLQALEPRQRKDAGVQRNLISREWDKLCAPLLTQEQCEQLATDLQHYIRGLWAAGYGWPDIVGRASAHLGRITRELNPQIPEEQLKTGCVVSRGSVETERQSRLLYIKRTDAKQFNDVFVPRIRRHRSNLFPMDIVVGDVHPIDILLNRTDGSIATPRAISWLDIATNRLYVSIVLLEKGQGVRRQDVALSFSTMASAWGLPKKLYLDNGSEYQWAEMLNGFNELSKLAQSSNVYLGLPDDYEHIIRARPYSANSKPIEGIFGILERKYLSKIQGWIGGDRMAKKSENMGQAPVPYKGSWEEFFREFQLQLMRYHSTPQKGTLKQRSPNVVLKDFIASGWQATGISEQALLLAFSETYERRVWQGGCIIWENLVFQSDELIPFVTVKGVNPRVKVKVPTHDPKCLFAFINDKVIHVPMDENYPFWDPDYTGAKEQQRRKKVLSHYVAEMGKNCSRMDNKVLAEEMLDDAPPAPEIPFGGEVVLGEELSIMTEQFTQQTPPLLPKSPPQLPSRFGEEEEVTVQWGQD